MIKRKGYYFLITSGQTSWTFNEASYFRATNIFGPYTAMGDPCVGADTATTYHSQGTYAFPVHGKKDAFIFMSERHNTARMTDSSFIFLPIQFPSATTVKLEYLPHWDLGHWP